MPTHRGLRHLALRVTDLARSRAFYERFLAMKVVWEPDPDNVYFSSGSDNLALHQIAPAELAQYQPLRGQLLDHVGVIMENPAQVDDLFGQPLERRGEHVSLSVEGLDVRVLIASDR